MSGFPARTASFPTRRLAERWAKTVEAEMIEGRHFRNVEARRRTLADAIDRYCADELGFPADASTDPAVANSFLRAQAAADRPLKKRGARARIIRLRWWREKLGNAKLADITPALLVEYRSKLTRETYTRAKPGAPGSMLERGDEAREFKRSAPTVDRYVAYLSHVLSIARRKWHWIGRNPFDGVGKFSEGVGRVRVLSEAERKALLEQIFQGFNLSSATWYQNANQCEEWVTSFGPFSSKPLWYALYVQDGYGSRYWDNNNGRDYTTVPVVTRVSQNSARVLPGTGSTVCAGFELELTVSPIEVGHRAGIVWTPDAWHSVHWTHAKWTKNINDTEAWKVRVDYAADHPISFWYALFVIDKFGDWHWNNNGGWNYTT